MALAHQHAHRPGPHVPARPGRSTRRTPPTTLPQRRQRHRIPQKQRQNRRNLRQTATLRRFQFHLVQLHRSPPVYIPHRLHSAALPRPLQATENPPSAGTEKPQPATTQRRRHCEQTPARGRATHHHPVQRLASCCIPQRRRPRRSTLLFRRKRLQPGTL